MTITLDRPVAPVVDSFTHREFIGMMAAAGLLAACGNDDSAGSDRGTTSDDGTFTVRSDSTIEVPADPKRVVAAIGSFETDIGVEMFDDNTPSGFRVT